MTENEKQIIASEIESDLDAVINFCEERKKTIMSWTQPIASKELHIKGYNEVIRFCLDLEEKKMKEILLGESNV